MARIKGERSGWLHCVEYAEYYLSSDSGTEHERGKLSFALQQCFRLGAINGQDPWGLRKTESEGVFEN